MEVYCGDEGPELWKKQNRKGAREMLDMKITEVDSTSPGYQLDRRRERSLSQL